MIKLNFENCLQLLLKVEDQSIEPDDIPLLKVKHEQWQQCLSINLFLLDKEKKIFAKKMGWEQIDELLEIKLKSP